MSSLERGEEFEIIVIKRTFRGFRGKVASTSSRLTETLLRSL